MSASAASVREVREFWNAHPCNSAYSEANERARYFDDIERARYEREAHVPEVARFEMFAGRRVLEIGCGIGIDGLQFVRHGAEYTAIDLSDASLRLATERFELAGARAQFLNGNAEELPFAGGSFDHIFSFGAIHHSPHTEHIVAEMHRVLRPNGTVCVMIYNRSSINYQFEIKVLRKAFRQALRPRFMPALLSRLSGFEQAKLERHRELLLSRGDLSEEAWLSMNTDGPDCPLARVYDEREARRLFAGFEDVETYARHFDRSHWPLVGDLLPNSTVRRLGERWGWHRIVWARKREHSTVPA